MMRWHVRALQHRGYVVDAGDGPPHEGEDVPLLSRADALRRRAQKDGPPSIVVVCALTGGSFPVFRSRTNPHTQSVRAVRSHAAHGSERTCAGRVFSRRCAASARAAGRSSVRR